ncbi:MAG TPA: hypothetical protein VI462_15760 [Acidimicrobiia bacterium]
MGRIETLTAQTGGAAEMVTPASAWAAAAIVTDRFGAGAARGRPATQIVNWVRLGFVSRAITNRDRTAVVGVGGPRPAVVAAVALGAGWLAPRLPRWVLLAAVAGVVGFGIRKGRLQRLAWITRTLRREAPDAILLGEFAARQPGAGVAFAEDVLDAIGAQATLALTVQGGAYDRRTRSLERLYERRLGFEVLDRQAIAGDDVVLMVRRAPVPDAAPLRAVG